jgi:hypothetical protein
MKQLILTLSCMLWIVSSLTGGQSEEADPYSISLVQKALNARSQGMTIAKIQTNLSRKGDLVSIALLKALNEGELTDPHVVELFLPVIRDSFSQPEIISIDADKKPKVTLFLLNFLQRNVRDSKTQRDIEETIKFVNEKAKIDSPMSPGQ